MNAEKRQFFKSFQLQIGLVDLIPYLVALVPQNELIYAIEYIDSARGGHFNEQVLFNPPYLPSELLINSKQHVREMHTVNVSDEQIKIKTKSIKKTSTGYISEEKVYSSSVLDLIDP
jgi:hypothetical protein